MNYRENPYRKRYPELASLDSGDRRKPINNQVLQNVIWYLRNDYSGLQSVSPRVGAIVYRLNGFDIQTSVFKDNLIWHGHKPVRVYWIPYNKCKKKFIYEWIKLNQIGFDKGSAIKDPLFVDQQNDNYKLRENSPAYNLGFKSIPIEKIGLYKSELRASWPVSSCVVSKDNRRKVHTIKIQ